MAPRTLIPAATPYLSIVGAVTLGLVASLVLATPVSTSDLAASGRPSSTTSPEAGDTTTSPETTAGPETIGPETIGLETIGLETIGLETIGLGSVVLGAEGFNPSGLSRWRRRGSTVDRCARTGRRMASGDLLGPRPIGPRRVVSRDQVALGGCRYFLRHGTLDMDELAGELAISRATLYRVVHSRDRLLADVLWRLAEHALWRARKERTSYGVEGVLQVGRRFSAQLLDAKPLRTFLTTEPDVAARVLLTATGGVHHRAVAAQKEIFVEATPPGHVWLSGDLDSRAYLLVRIFESTLYADLLASRQPDRSLAERAIRAVLPETPITT